MLMCVHSVPAASWKTDSWKHSGTSVYVVQDPWTDTNQDLYYRNKIILNETEQK